MALNLEVEREIKACNGMIKKYTNGILYFSKNGNITKSTPEGTMDLFQSITKIQGNEKSPMLLSIQGLKDIQMDCRMFLMNSLPEIATSIAFVIDNDPVTRAQFNISSYLRKKTIPIELFHSEEEAIEWLSSQ